MHEECKNDNTKPAKQFRAQETLEDVEEEYLTDGDRAFFYLTRAKFHFIAKNWVDARTEAEKALTII